MSESKNYDSNSNYYEYSEKEPIILRMPKQYAYPILCTNNQSHRMISVFEFLQRIMVVKRWINYRNSNSDAEEDLKAKLRERISNDVTKFDLV
jgi:hypothetical protein